MVTLGKIKFINPELLKKNQNNPFKKLRKEEFNKLVESIKSKGILNPILVNKDYTILEGHNRREAALLLQLEKVPVIVASLSKAEYENEIQSQLNINRRQISYHDKKNLIKANYGAMLKTGGNRGKNRWGGTTLNLAKTISSKTGIPEGTVSRIIAELRKEMSASEIKQHGNDLSGAKIKQAVTLYREYTAVEKKEKELKLIRHRLKKEIEEIAPLSYIKTISDT